MTVTRELLAYYEQDMEHARLREGRNRLEFWRTQDVLRRILPDAPARVLDVGGGTGVHAEWLAADGYDVQLLDPVPLHVERAAALPGVSSRLGDARRLPVPDSSADAVLLLGPLYHLAERADRVRALAEARRAVRPGGVVVAATINRHAAVLDTVCTGHYLREAERRAARGSAEHGVMLSPGRGFTAYFHDPEDVPGEFADAGFPEVRLESVPSLLGVSGHLLTAAAG